MILLDKFPLWSVYVITVVLVLIAAEIGFRIGIRLRRHESDSGAMSMTGAMVGGLLGLVAFLLAFSIGIVIDQHSSRKAMVVTEANAITNAYLQAGFLDESDRTASRDLLREYVEARLAIASDPSLYDSGMMRSEAIQDQLWSIVEENVLGGRNDDIMAQYAETINELIEVHEMRLAAVHLRLPRTLGIVMYVATVLSFMLVGIASSSDGKRDFIAISLFALAFVAVLIILADLDQPARGLINVSQDSLKDVLRRMTTSAP